MFLIGLIIYFLVPVAVFLSEGARGFVTTSYALSPEITIAILVFYVYPFLVFLAGVVLKKRGLINRKVFKTQVVLASTLAISLGLIGTFVGLASMVAGIAGGMAADGDFATKMSAMLESISAAMDSMSLAFLTSILGVATSIVILFSGNFMETFFPIEASGSAVKSGGEVIKDELVTLRQSSNENFGVLSEDLKKTTAILTDQSQIWSDLYLLLESRAGEDVIAKMTESLDVHNRVLNNLASIIKETNEQQLRGFNDLKSSILQSHQNTIENNERNTRLLVDQSVLTRDFQSDLQSKTNSLIDGASQQLNDVSGILQDIRLAMALPLDELLRKALKEDTLGLVYQKQVDANNHVVGYEAYLRWEDHVRGFIPPDRLIEVARETNMIIDVNKWVFKTAIKQISEWYAHNMWHDDMTLSINLSSEFLLSPSFTSFIRQNLNAYNLPTKLVAVEITEEVISSDPESCIDKLSQLKSMGLKCYIDDFGSGYTSIKTLRDLKVDLIKIDRGIVDDINSENLSVIKSIINMAEELNILAACEGVESQEQLDKLNELGCVLFQGYHIGKPVLASQIEVLS